MPYPSDFPWLIYTLVFFLAILIGMILLNFVLVIFGKTETPIYQQFDKLSSVFIRIFGVVLLLVMVWGLLARMFGRNVG